MGLGSTISTSIPRDIAILNAIDVMLTLNEVPIKIIFFAFILFNNIFGIMYLDLKENI